MEEITRNGIPRSPSARQPAPRPEEEELFAPRRNTSSILEQISLTPHLNLSAQKVTINSPMVTTAPAVSVCYVCRGQGHTASCCFFAAIHPVKLRPVWCGAAEQARRQMWLNSGDRGPYMFATSPPFALLPNPSAENITQTNISFSGQTHYPEPIPDDDETLDQEEEVSHRVQEVAEAESPQRQQPPATTPRRLRSPSVAVNQTPSWQQLEETAKEMQRQAQALLNKARNQKKRAELLKEIQKEEKAALDARDRAEKSKKRLRDIDNESH